MNIQFCPFARLGKSTLRLSISLHAKLQEILEDYRVTLLYALGFALLIAGMSNLSHASETTFSEADFDDTLIRHSVGNLFMLIEGAFGALIMVVAGLGAIISAAMGGYRAALGMLVVSVGAFILRALVSLFFGTDYSEFISNT